MTRHKNNRQQLSGKERLQAYGIALILLTAPLYRGGNRPLPLMALEIFAVLLLIITVWPSDTPEKKPSPDAWWLVGGGVLLLYPLLYLIPIPFSWWSGFPGRGSFVEGLSLVNPVGQPWRPLSIVAMMTETAWLALFPPVAVFLATVRLPSKLVIRLAILVLLMATFQALLGLFQSGVDADSWLCFVMSRCGKVGAVGSYVNPAHLAGLLEMTLPLAGALLAAAIIGRGKNDSADKNSGLRDHLSHFKPQQKTRIQWYGVASIIIVLGAVFTLSRSGIIIIQLALLLTVSLFTRDFRRRHQLSVLSGTIALLLLLVLFIGLIPVVDQFASDPLSDGRWLIYPRSLESASLFFPIGSGPGTYPAVFKPLTPIKLGYYFINHAHNDYLEWFVESGLISIGIVLLVFVAYLKQWRQLWRQQEWSQFQYLQAGGGIGLLMIALHNMVDFNWHIPANAIYSAFFGALFFHQIHRHRGEHPNERSHRMRMAALKRQREQPPQPLKPAASPPPPNPFLR